MNNDDLIEKIADEILCATGEDDYIYTAKVISKMCRNHYIDKVEKIIKADTSPSNVLFIRDISTSTKERILKKLNDEV